jgi:hypothetical protein
MAQLMSSSWYVINSEFVVAVEWPHRDDACGAIDVIMVHAASTGHVRSIGWQALVSLVFDRIFSHCFFQTQ